MYMRTRKHIKQTRRRKLRKRKSLRLMKGGTNWCHRPDLPLYISSIHGEAYTAPFFGRPIAEIVKINRPLFAGIDRLSPP